MALGQWGGSSAVMKGIPSGGSPVSDALRAAREATYGEVGDLSISYKDSSVRVYDSANQSITHDTWTSITFDTEVFDTADFHDSANPSRLTMPADGKYLIFANVRFAANATGTRGIRIFVNGTTNRFEVQVPAVNIAAGNNLGGCTYLDLLLSDYIEVQAYQDSTAALNVLASGTLFPSFGALRIA